MAKSVAKFAALVSKFKGQGKSSGSAKAIAATVGRKKLGEKKMTAMAVAGKKKAKKKPKNFAEGDWSYPGPGVK